MNLDSNEQHRLLEKAIQAWIAPDARLLKAEERPIGAHGHSGAALRRFNALYESSPGTTGRITILIKHASLVERRVLALLHAQGHRQVPLSYSDDLSTDAPAWICQQYICGDLTAAAASSTQQAARGLAEIHHRNLGQDQRLDWLPRANRAYLESGYVLGNWQNTWAQAMAHPAFVREFGGSTGKLEAAATRFLDAMDDLWDIGTSLTLIHADLHDQHVIVQASCPYFVDWGQARYGSFYLDLPNYFSAQSISSYRKALARLGHGVPAANFAAGYRQAGRYVGFKYMGFHLQCWLQGGQVRRHARTSLIALIKLAISGRELD